MILDLGAPVSLAGNEWMNQYLKDHGLELKDLKSSKCHQIFKFGPSKQYISKLMVELPVIVRRLDGKEDVLQVFTYLVDTDVPFLCRKRELKDRWKSKIDTENNILEIKTDGKRKNFKMIGTRGNHVALEIEKRDLEDWRYNKDCYIMKNANIKTSTWTFYPEPWAIDMSCIFLL